MADIKRIIEGLDSVLHVGVVDSSDVKVIEDAIDLIKRLTKPMTLERAVEILNETEQGQARYEIIDGLVYVFEGRNQMSLEPMTEFVAIAIAEKIERKREAASG